jgi:hypothetical protein
MGGIGKDNAPYISRSYAESMCMMGEALHLIQKNNMELKYL